MITIQQTYNRDATKPRFRGDAYPQAEPLYKPGSYIMYFQVNSARFDGMPLFGRVSKVRSTDDLRQVEGGKSEFIRTVDQIDVMQLGLGGMETRVGTITQIHHHDVLAVFTTQNDIAQVHYMMAETLSILGKKVKRALPATISDAGKHYYMARDVSVFGRYVDCLFGPRRIMNPTVTSAIDVLRELAERYCENVNSEFSRADFDSIKRGDTVIDFEVNVYGK